jgi:hypothetical protein
VANPAREAWKAFYSPPRESCCWVSENWTCTSRGLDISDNHLWNLAKKPDKARVTLDKADRPNMSGLEAGHVSVGSLEPG